MQSLCQEGRLLVAFLYHRLLFHHNCGNFRDFGVSRDPSVPDNLPSRLCCLDSVGVPCRSASSGDRPFDYHLLQGLLCGVLAHPVYESPSRRLDNVHRLCNSLLLAITKLVTHQPFRSFVLNTSVRESSRLLCLICGSNCSCASSSLWNPSSQ